MSWDEAFAHRYDVRAGKLDEHPVGLPGEVALAQPDATEPEISGQQLQAPLNSCG
jgi:hypothetical protein